MLLMLCRERGPCVHGDGARAGGLRCAQQRRGMLRRAAGAVQDGWSAGRSYQAGWQAWV